MAKSSKGNTNLMSGLKKSAPSGTEKAPSGPSVNSEPTRSGVAPTPGTLGGRVA